MTRRARYVGRRARNLGAELEHYLLKQAAQDPRFGGVILRHIPTRLEPLRRLDPTKDPSLWVCRLKGGSTWVDFTARLPDGQSVDFEAKATANEKHWPLPPRLRPGGVQRELLFDLARRGQVAFVYLWRVGAAHPLEQPQEYVIPVTKDGWPFSETTQVRWSKLDKYRLSRGQTWLDAVAKQDKEEEEDG